MDASEAGGGDGEPGFEMTLRPGAVQNGGGFTSEDRDARYPAGNSSAAGAIANFVNTIVGAGIVGLPFALAQVCRLREAWLVCTSYTARLRGVERSLSCRHCLTVVIRGPNGVSGSDSRRGSSEISKELI